MSSVTIQVRTKTVHGVDDARVITMDMARTAVLRHTVTESARDAWRFAVRDGRMVVSFESTVGHWQDRVVVPAIGGGATIAQRTDDGQIHLCTCGRCPRPAIRELD